MASAPTTVRDTQTLLDPKYRDVRPVGLESRQPAPRRNQAAAYHEVGRALLEQAARTGRKEAASAAVEVFRIALQWAPVDPSLHNALGASLVELGRVESVAAAIEALAAAGQEFEAASTEATRSHVPPAASIRYQINLAMTLWMLGERAEDEERIGKSVSLLESIIARLPESSVHWPHVQDNLGNALMAMERPADALTAYQAGLRGRCSGTERARLLGNLSTAYLAMGRSTEACDCCKEALALIQRDRWPLAWSRLQHNHACALLQAALTGARQEAGNGLRDAVTAFELALAEREHNRLPQDWAISTVNLAGALLALGTHMCARLHGRETGIGHLRKATSLYQEALPELTAGDRAKTERNAALAREILGKVSDGEVMPPPLPDGMSWPTETYAQAHRERREGIVQFLDRVWQPLIKAGAVDLRTLRARDPSAAKGIDNYKRRVDPASGKLGRLPPHLDIPTKKQLNDRLAEMIATPGDRPARLDWALRARRKRIK
ncbi:MAG TPA: hypothetical protein VL614_23695 [Acetobacteraceae bacterium]|jgi:tetratricopeptide (TPR) repeat protein|nr:hypothetical protein [Acetobacteraceae bacterium]